MGRAGRAPRALGGDRRADGRRRALGDVRPGRRSRSASSVSADIFAALFFFVFGALHRPVGAFGDVGWILALAVVAYARRQDRRRLPPRGWPAGSRKRQSLNVGIALVAHGEFTIVLAQIASTNGGPSPAPTARGARRVRGALRARGLATHWGRADEGVEGDRPPPRAPGPCPVRSRAAWRAIRGVMRRPRSRQYVPYWHSLRPCLTRLLAPHPARLGRSGQSPRLAGGT